MTQSRDAVRARTERYAVPTEYGDRLTQHGEPPMMHGAWCEGVREASGGGRALPPQARLDTRVLHSHDICPACFHHHWRAHIG
jgi:hypothetical protein